MPYCHRCGKSASENDDFCGHCGTKIKEFIEHAEQNIERAVKKNHRGFVVFILFLLIIGYVILDIWAMGQLKPVLSLDSIISSVSSLQGSTSLTSASASTTIRIENPTFIPVIAGRVVYDAGYGSTKVAEGETDMIVMGPYSTKDLPADVKVSYVGGAVSVGKWLVSLFTGSKETWNANAYIDIGITKFKIGSWG